jgi:hypothetical protein
MTRRSQPGGLHGLQCLAPAALADPRVAGDRCEARVPEGLGGEAGIPERLLEQGAQSVAETRWVEARKAEVGGPWWQRGVLQLTNRRMAAAQSGCVMTPR